MSAEQTAADWLVVQRLADRRAAADAAQEFTWPAVAGVHTMIALGDGRAVTALRSGQGTWAWLTPHGRMLVCGDDAEARTYLRPPA